MAENNGDEHPVPPPAPPPPPLNFGTVTYGEAKKARQLQTSFKMGLDSLSNLGAEFESQWDDIVNDMKDTIESVPLNTNLRFEPPEDEHDIFKAVRNNDCGMIGRLVHHGLDVNYQQKGERCSVRNQFLTVSILTKGYTPLHMASLFSDLRTIHYLRHLGAEVDARDTSDRTPLHFAVNAGRSDVVQYLLKNGADPNVESSSSSTPLRLAVKRQHVEVVKMLLSSGANVNLQDPNGITVLHQVVFSIVVSLQLVDVLLRGGADVNIRSKKGATPLLMAVPSKNIKVIETLLDAGADVNEGDNSGVTPFHLINVDTGKKAFTVARLLVSKGADINLKDKTGLSPLQKSIQFSNLAAILFLLELDCYRNTDIMNSEQMFSLRRTHPRFDEAIEREMCAPWSLLRLCRYQIRNHVSTVNLKHLDTLPLPRTLKDYLQFKY